MTPTYQLMEIPNGANGIRETLRLMSKIVKRYKTAPMVRELSLSLVFPIADKDWKGEANAIFRYVRDNIRYVKDVRGCETLQSPIQTLRLMQGDCDDHAILSASLLEAIGHPTRFLAVGFKPDSYSHVFAQTKIGDRWVTLECTMKDWNLGRTPAKIKNRMTQHN